MVIDNKYAKMWKDDGIVFFVYKPVRCIDLVMAEKVVLQRLELQNGIEYPILCDLRAVYGADKAARDYLGNQGSLLTKAQAFLVESNYTLFLLNMYLRTTAVNTTIQVFKEESKALTFLSQFK